MKASEALAITKRAVLMKEVMPEIYKKIRSSAENGFYDVNIGKPAQSVLDILKLDGFKIYCGEDDGDAHSTRCLYYMCSWKD